MLAKVPAGASTVHVLTYSLHSSIKSKYREIIPEFRYISVHMLENSVYVSKVET